MTRSKCIVCRKDKNNNCPRTKIRESPFEHHEDKLTEIFCKYLLLFPFNQDFNVTKSDKQNYWFERQLKILCSNGVSLFCDDCVGFVQSLCDLHKQLQIIHDKISKNVSHISGLIVESSDHFNDGHHHHNNNDSNGRKQKLGTRKIMLNEDDENIDNIIDNMRSHVCRRYSPRVTLQRVQPSQYPPPAAAQEENLQENIKEENYDFDDDDNSELLEVDLENEDGDQNNYYDCIKIFDFPLPSDTTTQDINVNSSHLKDLKLIVEEDDPPIIITSCSSLSNDNVIVQEIQKLAEMEQYDDDDFRLCTTTTTTTSSLPHPDYKIVELQDSHHRLKLHDDGPGQVANITDDGEQEEEENGENQSVSKPAASLVIMEQIRNRKRHSRSKILNYAPDKFLYGVWHFERFKEKGDNGTDDDEKYVFKCGTCGQVRSSQPIMIQHLHYHRRIASAQAAGESGYEDKKTIKIGESKFLYNGEWTFEKVDGGGFKCLYSTCQFTTKTQPPMIHHLKAHQRDKNCRKTKLKSKTTRLSKINSSHSHQSKPTKPHKRKYVKGQLMTRERVRQQELAGIEKWVKKVSNGTFAYKDEWTFQADGDSQFKCGVCPKKKPNWAGILRHAHYHLRRAQQSQPAKVKDIIEDEDGSFIFQQKWKFQPVTTGRSGFSCCIDDCRVFKSSFLGMVNHMRWHSLPDEEKYVNGAMGSYLNSLRKNKPLPKSPDHAVASIPVDQLQLERDRLTKVPNRRAQVQNVGDENQFVYQTQDGRWPFQRIEGGQYQCGTCGVVRKQRPIMLHHISRSHAAQTPVICETCGSSFKTLWELKMHSERHTELRKFMCDKCGKSFKMSRELSTHMHYHAGTHTCGHCSKVFRTKTQLDEHQLSHVDTKMFSCSHEGCDKTFKYKKGLQHHERKHVLGKQFCCHLCQKLFFTTFEVDQHMRHNHKSVENVTGRTNSGIE